MKHLLSHAEFASPGVSARYAPDLGLEPVHLELAVRIDPATRSLEGEATWTVLVRDPEAGLTLDAIDLDDLAVSEPDGGALQWRYDGERVQVGWDAPAQAGERRRVTLRWTVRDPLTGLLFDDGGTWAVTDHETERARYWLPCLDHPNVRTSLDVRVRAPASMTALSNGEQVSRRENDDGTATTRWSLTTPCPAYLFCVAVGDFARADGGEADGVPCAFFAPAPYTEADLLRAFGPTAEMLRWMTGKLDSAFPFPKYFQFAVPGIGGAMENISLVSWDDRAMMDEALAAEQRWKIDLINVHEMAHSWFGDAVVCRDYAHVWLKESWATYMETVWLEETEGPDAAQWWRREKSRSYRAEADGRYVRPIQTRDYDSSWDMFDMHLYPGGALRLHLLRKELGDAVFWAGVQAYLATYQGRVVETADFRRALEEVSGRSLVGFFDLWFRSKGYPKLKASWSWDGKVAEATLKIEQRQVNAKAGVGRFAFTLPVAVRTDGAWQRHTIRIEEDRAQLVIRSRKRPDAVVIDPDADCLFSLEWSPGTDMLAAALREAPTAAGRLQAAEALGGSARKKAVNALEGAYPVEASWTVRAEIARALGRAGTASAGEALARLLAQEEDPRSMGALCEACGKHRMPGVAEALRAWLEAPRPHLATAAALRSLAAQRDEADLDRLEGAASDSGWWGHAAQGALRGLGLLRSERGLEAILDHLDPETALPQVRAVAAVAAGAAARWLAAPAQERALRALEGMRLDPSYRARRAAALGLKELGTARAAAAIERLLPVLADQDHAAVQRDAAAIRRTLKEGGRVQELSRQVEALRERTIKAEKRLEELEARPRGRRA